MKPLSLFFCLFLLALTVRGEHPHSLPIIEVEVNVSPSIFSKVIPNPSSREGVRIGMDRVETRPGERWLRGQIKIAPELIDGSTIHAAVLGVGQDKPAATLDAAASPLSKIKVNLRDASLEQGRLLVQVTRDRRVIAQDEIVLRAPAVPEVDKTVRIPVSVDIDFERTADTTGITVGVPFASGSLWDVSRLGVVNEKGESLPAQITPVAWWHQDGSVRWARVDTLYKRSHEKIFVSVNEAAHPKPSQPVIIEEKNDQTVEVRIGKTRYVLGTAESPIQALYENGALVMSTQGGKGLYVVDQNGRVGTASAKDASLTIESRGPVEASIKIAGPYRASDGKEMARYETRLEFFSGESQARIGHTFIVSQPTNHLWFREIGWEFKIPHTLSDPKAVFNVDPNQWKENVAVSLERETSVSLNQTQHYRFFQGENQSSLTQSKRGEDRILARGKEMGDWAAITSRQGGFLVGLRDAAKRYPKEFIATESSVRVLLFSPQGGNELNFHSASIAKDIGLKKLIELSDPTVNADLAVRKLGALDADALGWAKTHEMVLSPVRQGEEAGQFARSAALMDYPAQALSSPEWLYQTKVLGRLHPYDPNTFSEIESYVERSVDAFKKFGDVSGEYGFRDYQGGPHFIKSFNPPQLELWRWQVGYNMRVDLWHLYARRGQRSLRDFAEGSTRAYFDNKLIHWGSAGKTRGLISLPPGEDHSGPTTPFNVPISWGDSVPEISSNGDLGMFLLDYYLTGNRRAADGVKAYGEGMKKVWKADSDSWRRLRVIQNLVWAYTLDWEEELGDLARATANKSVDPEGALGLSTDKPLATTYKTQSDFPIAPLVAWALDDSRYDDIASHLADYWRDTYFEPALRYSNPDGYVASYLYDRTGDKGVAESLAVKLRQLEYLAKKDKEGKPEIKHHVSTMGFLMHGFALAQDIVLRSGAWKEPVASTQGFMSYVAAPRWFIKKTTREALVFRIRFGEDLVARRLEQSAGGNIIVRPVGFGSDFYNQDLQRIISFPNGAIVEISKDAPLGIYEICAANHGRFAIVADTLVPLMAALAGPWKPLPLQSPTPAIYFEVPPDANQPKLNLSGRAKVFQINGKSRDLRLEESESTQPWQTGTIDLHEGLWKVQLETSSTIHGENFAPLFAFDRSENLFTVPKEIDLTPNEKQPFASPETGIELTAKDSLSIDFPEQEMLAGTVEFYYRPSRPLGEADPVAKFVTLKNIDPAPQAQDLTLAYTGFSQNPKSEYAFYSRHRMQLKTDPKQGKSFGGRTNLRHYLLPNRWIHVAFEWGVEGAYKRKPETYTRIYINGSRGNNVDQASWEYERHIRTKRIIIGPGLEGTISGLRISNTARYLMDRFTPPSIGNEDWRDSETLGAWTFSEPLGSEAKQGSVSCTKKSR